MSSWRDTTCGVLRASDAGKRVKVAGWTDARRDHGGLVFVDLRDFSGKVQLVINPERTADAAANSRTLPDAIRFAAASPMTSRNRDTPVNTSRRSRSTSGISCVVEPAKIDDAGTWTSCG